MRILARGLSAETPVDAVCGHCGWCVPAIRFQHSAYDMIPVHDASAAQGCEVAACALVKENCRCCEQHAHERGHDAEWDVHTARDRLNDKTRGHGHGLLCVRYVVCQHHDA